MYSFTIYAVASNPKAATFVSDSCVGDGYCANCPANTYCSTDEVLVCLVTCLPNEFISDNGICIQCDDSCVDGCIRSENCNPCLDMLCVVCDNYDGVCE